MLPTALEVSTSDRIVEDGEHAASLTRPRISAKRENAGSPTEAGVVSLGEADVPMRGDGERDVCRAVPARASPETRVRAR